MAQSARERESLRKRSRAFLAPHWRRLKSEYLTTDEATVLGLRLGIASDVAVPQTTIARRLHVSSMTVAMIERRALGKCRRVLRTEGRDA